MLLGAIGCYRAVPRTATATETSVLETLGLQAGEALERSPESLPTRGFLS